MQQHLLVFAETQKGKKRDVLTASTSFGWEYNDTFSFSVQNS